MRTILNSIFSVFLFMPALAYAQETQGVMTNVPSNERDLVGFIIVLLMAVVLGVILVLILKDPRKLFRVRK